MSTSELAQPGQSFTASAPPLLFLLLAKFIPFGEIDLAASVGGFQDLMDGWPSKHGTLPSLCSVTVTATHLTFLPTREFPCCSPCLLQGRSSKYSLTAYKVFTYLPTHLGI